MQKRQIFVLWIVRIKGTIHRITWDYGVKEYGQVKEDFFKKSNFLYKIHKSSNRSKKEKIRVQTAADGRLFSDWHYLTSDICLRWGQASFTDLNWTEFGEYFTCWNVPPSWGHAYVRFCSQSVTRVPLLVCPGSLVDFESTCRFLVGIQPAAEYNSNIFQI